MASLTTNKPSTTSLPRYTPVLKKKVIGLDPIFRSTIKLHIRDIEQLQIADVEAEGEKRDLFTFQKHVIHKVEVMGIVVRADKREKRHTYAVDDGTGVIHCTFWKRSARVTKPAVRTQELPPSLHEKFQELQSFNQEVEDTGYDLGDLVLMRGRVTIFRGDREIDVLDHRKLDNPNAEYERHLELPSLYSIYAKSFIPPSTVAQELAGHSDTENTFNKFVVQEAVLTYLDNQQNFQETFTPSDVLSWPSVASLRPQTDAETDDESLLNTVRAVLQAIETSKGSVCRRSGTGDVYEVVKADCPLAVKILAQLSEVCQSGHSAANGCHLHHIHRLVNAVPEYANVQLLVVSYLLNCLETSSDLVCVAPQRYLPI